LLGEEYNMKEKHQGQQIILCKKCGSNMIKKSIVIHFLIALWLVTPFALLIPWVGWAFCLLVYFLSVNYLINRIFVRKEVLVECTACQHSFKVDKQTYIQFKNYLRS